MTYGKTKEHTPEELEKIRKARKEQAIFAGYYWPRCNKWWHKQSRRVKK